MKCNKTNACLGNPNRKSQKDDLARNYSRQPIREHEHGECPFRKNGKCTSDDMQIKRIRLLRQTIKDYRVYADEVKQGIGFKYEFTLKENLTKYGFKVKELVNPKNPNERNMYAFGLTGYKGGTVYDYLEGLVAYQLDKIDPTFISYVDLLKKFFIKANLWSDGIKIELYGNFEDFNDESILNWESEFGFDTRWYGKEFMIGKTKVQVNIRETLPPKKDGELNNER